MFESHDNLAHSTPLTNTLCQTEIDVSQLSSFIPLFQVFTSEALVSNLLPNCSNSISNFLLRQFFDQSSLNTPKCIKFSSTCRDGFLDLFFNIIGDLKKIQEYI